MQKSNEFNQMCLQKMEKCEKNKQKSKTKNQNLFIRISLSFGIPSFTTSTMRLLNKNFKKSKERILQIHRTNPYFFFLKSNQCNSKSCINT